MLTALSHRVHRTWVSAVEFLRFVSVVVESPNRAFQVNPSTKIDQVNIDIQ